MKGGSQGGEVVSPLLCSLVFDDLLRDLNKNGVKIVILVSTLLNRSYAFTKRQNYTLKVLTLNETQPIFSKEVEYLEVIQFNFYNVQFETDSLPTKNLS